jgi:hypothetical protein
MLEIIGIILVWVFLTSAYQMISGVKHTISSGFSKAKAIQKNPFPKECN